MAAGGVGDFTDFGDIRVREGDKDNPGPLLAGPIHEPDFHVGGADGGGSGALCPAPPAARIGTGGWVCIIIIGIALLAALLGVSLAISLK